MQMCMLTDLKASARGKYLKYMSQKFGVPCYNMLTLALFHVLASVWKKVKEIVPLSL